MVSADKYAIQLLKTTIENQDPTLIEVLESNSAKMEQLFSDNQIELLELIKSSYLINSKIPTKEFFSTYFKHEKNSMAKDAYLEIINSDLTLLTDIKETIELGVSLKIKQKTKEALKSIGNSINLSNASSIAHTIDMLQDELAGYKEALETNTHSEMILYGENAQQAYLSDYTKRKNGELSTYIGKFGISAIDDTITGYGVGDLVHIAGFTNQGKSPMLRFLSYQLLLQGLNVVFFTLEISIDRIREQFFVLHANNGKRFGYNNPKITTDKLKRGELTDEEENFLLNKVIPDFTNSDDMGSLIIIQPDSEYTFDDMCMKVRKINKNTMPVDVLVLDYATILLPSKNLNRVDTNSINLMLRRLKQFALTFKKHGQDKPGILVLNAAQTNRDGFLDAVKDPTNKYNLSALGQYNSLEKDANIIFSVLQTDEMKAAGEVQMQALKVRDGQFCQPFKLIFDGSTGFYYETVNKDISEDDKMDILEDIDL